MPSAPSSGLDGRQSRTMRSRLAICEACLDLVQEGTLQPSADQIAERAGVSRRSVFNHFADLAELYDAVVEVGMQRCEPLLEKVDDSEPLRRRIELYVSARAKFLDATSQFTLALTAQSLAGTAPDQALRVSRDSLRADYDEVERLFGRDLMHLPARERDEIIEAMSATMSPLQWEHLRRSRQISRARSRSIINRILSSILRGAGLEV